MKTIFEQIDNMSNNAVFVAAICIMGAIFLFLVIAGKIKEDE